MCDDLMVDALYHLHLLHPSRFRNDTLTEFGRVPHHLPETKTNDGIAIVRFHTKTNEYEALTWDPSGTNVKLSPLDHHITINQKWKTGSNSRVIPAKNIESETGMSLYLSLLRPKEEAQFLWPISTKFILGLSETKPPKENILQGWNVKEKGIVPAVVEYLNVWKEWGIGLEDENVVFKKLTEEEEKQYGWGIWRCPLLC